jgi:hypothetical protein
MTLLGAITLLGGVSIKLSPIRICCPDDFYAPSDICVLDLCRGGLLIGGQFQHCALSTEVYAFIDGINLAA